MNEAMSDRLIGICVERGWLAPSAADRARSLVAHGLRPEQALVGTGLVSVDRYGEALERASGFPFSRVEQTEGTEFPESLHDDLRPLEALPMRREGRMMVVGLTNPTPDRLKRVRSVVLGHACKSEPVVILHADWRRAADAPRPLASVRRFFRNILGLADSGRAHEVSLGPHADHAGAWFDRQAEPSIHFPRPWLPALSLRVRRVGEEVDGWNVALVRGFYGPEFRLVRIRAGDAHPLEASDAFRQALSHPEGLVVVVNPDARMRTLLARQPLAMATDGPEDAERALHAALMGKSVIAVAPSRTSWEDLLAQGGFPHLLVERRAFADGSAWEVRRG